MKMKKLLSILLIISIFSSFLTSFASSPIMLMFNGETLHSDVTPVIVNDRVLVPARVIFEKLGATVTWYASSKQITVEGSGVQISMVIGNKNAEVNGKLVNLDVPPAIIADRTMLPIRFVSEALGCSVDWQEKYQTVTVWSKTVTSDVMIKSIIASTSKAYDLISIDADKLSSPTVSFYENPNRIVFDISKAKLTGNADELPLNGNFVTSVRYAMHDEFVRVVLDLSKDIDDISYQYLDDYGDISIKISSNEDCINYIGGQSPKVVLNDVSKISYKGSDEDLVFCFEITGQSIAEDSLKINDSNVEKIVVSKISSNNGELKVYAKKDFIFQTDGGSVIFKTLGTVTENPTDNPTVNPSVSGKLVVLDPGHGGKDPGALGYENGAIVLNEKDANLDISLKTYEILKNHGVNVYITRNTDVFLELSERTDIANSKDAALFVSIHNNSIADTSISGSLVLYKTGDPIGEKLAKNILNSIINDVGMIGRNIRDGSEMYVIRCAKMPSVIVECAFVTNKSDRDNLKNGDFTQKLANAIASGIELTLSQLS